jgi:hypothetical protein
MCWLGFDENYCSRWLPATSFDVRFLAALLFLQQQILILNIL